MLFVSHDLGLVKQLSDRAILLLNGRIAAQGEPQRRDQSLHRAGARSGSTQPERDVARARSAASYRHGDGTSEILERRNC